MKTYYSIVKIVPNPLVEDSISVGLILSDNERFFIKFSDSKIRIAKSLLGVNKKMIDFFIEQILRTLENDNQASRNLNMELFDKPKVFSAKYLNYLYNYNNNIIQYNKPQFIKEENNQNTFTNLFRLFIDKKLDNVQNFVIDNPWINTQDIISEKLIKRVEDKVHTNIKFSSKVIPNLYFNYEMDCIGLNGVFTGAKAINFNQSESTVHKEISDYYALATILENTHNRYGKKNNFFIISDEPTSIGSKEHKIWEKAKKLEKFLSIQSGEVETIAKKIEETKALKFLDLVS